QKRVERSGCPSGRQPDDILEESRHPSTDAEYTGNIFCIVCQRTGSLCVCLCTADEQCITASDPSVGTVRRRYYTETGVRKCDCSHDDCLHGDRHWRTE